MAQQPLQRSEKVVYSTNRAADKQTDTYAHSHGHCRTSDNKGHL